MAYNVTAQLNLQLNQQSIAQISQALNSITNGKSIGGNLFNSNGIRNITNELNQSKNAMMQFGEQAGLAAKRFGAFTLTAGSLVQVTQGFRTMLNEAIAFDREMVKLKQVSNETAGSGVAAIRQEIDKLSTGLGVSSSQLARVSVILKQANLNLGETKTALEALALSALAPNFDSMEKTAEGAIAVLKQFKIPVEELKSALGSINAVAGEFAVEASDLIGVIQRTGGAFKAAGGNLNELLALFTSVRQTTRESAESIATGLRTIFTRIQRTGTADALREVGVNLRYTRDEALALGNVDLTSQFVGAYEAVRRLSVALNQIPATDPKFAQLVEELGGYRQISKVIPLIQEFSISQQALNTAITGGASLMNSAAAAQGSFGNRLDKLKESYLQFGRALTDSSAFKTLFTAFETGAQAALTLMNVLKPLIPMLTIMATMKMAQGIGSFGAGFVKGVAPAKKSSGGLLHFKRGGIVPGSGHGDIVPAMLEPGEMVIPKRMVKKYSFGGPHTADIDEEALNNPSGFREYMKGSTTINPKTGKYRKFFHGTKGQDFDYFSNAHARNTWFGRGHYFSADAKVASRYSENDKTDGGYDPGARVLSTTLQMKNPYTWNSDKSLKDFMTKGGKKLKSIDGQFDQKDWDEIVKKGVLPEDISQGTLGHLNKIFTKFPSISKKWNQAYSEKIDKNGNKIIKGMSPESKMKFVAHGATQTLKKQGYDSVNVDYGLGRDYFNASTVFNPNQIKSLGNEGGWDPSLKEIGKNLGGYIGRQKFGEGGETKTGTISQLVGKSKLLSTLYDDATNENKVDDKFEVGITKALGAANQLKERDEYRAKAENFWNKANHIYTNSIDKKTKKLLSESARLDLANKYLKRYGGEHIQNLGPKELEGPLHKNNLNKIAGGMAESDWHKKNPRAKKLKDAEGADFITARGNLVEIKTNKANIPNYVLTAKALLAVGKNKNYKNNSKKPDNIITAITLQQALASGGFIVPGVGDTDSVPMDLPVGSYVIKKSSTKKMGFANGGVVPALLTPGELVIDPKTASGIGKAKLDHMNRTGRSAFAKGGRVGFAVGGDAFPIPSTTIHTPGQNQSLSNLYKQLPRLYQYLIDDLTKINSSINETIPLETHRKNAVIDIAGIYEKQLKMEIYHEDLIKQGNEAEAKRIKGILDEGKQQTSELMSKSSKAIQRREIEHGGKKIPLKYAAHSMESAFKNENPNAQFTPPKPLGPPPPKPSSPPPRPTTVPAPAPAPKQTGPAPAPQNPSGPVPSKPPMGPSSSSPSKLTAEDNKEINDLILGNQPPTPPNQPKGPTPPVPPKPPTGPPSPPSPSGGPPNKPPLGVPPPTPPKPSINPSNLIGKLTRVRANKALDDAGVNLKDSGTVVGQMKLMEMQKQRAQIEKEYIRHTMLQLKEMYPHLKSSERLTLAQNMFSEAMGKGTIAVNTRTNKVIGDTRLSANGETLMAAQRAERQSKKPQEPKGIVGKMWSGIKGAAKDPEMRMMLASAAMSYGAEGLDSMAGNAQDIASKGGEGSGKYKLAKMGAGGLQGAAMGASFGMMLGPIGGLIGGAIGGIAGAISSGFSANKELLGAAAADSQEKLGAKLNNILNKSQKLDLKELTSSINANAQNAGAAAGAPTGFLDYIGLGRSSAETARDVMKASEQARQQTAGQTSAVATMAISEKLGEQKGGIASKSNADLYKLSGTIIEADSNFMGLIESSRQVGESFTQAKERIIKESANMARAEAAKKAGAELEKTIGRSNSYLKTFADNLEGASVRVDASFKNFDSIMSSLEGGNRMPNNYQAEKTAKVFSNPAAFSGKEFKTAIESTFSQFGPELTKGLSDQYAPMADVANKLPQILAESIDSKNPLEEVQAKLEKIIPGGKDDPAVKAIITSIAAKMGSKDSLKDVTNDTSKLATEIMQPIMEPMTNYGSKIAQLTADNAAKLSASYMKLNNATMKLIEGMEQADHLRMEQAQTIQSATDLMRGGSGEVGPNPQAALGMFLGQQQRILGQAGRADLVGNTAGIGNALQESMNRQNAIEQTPANQMGGEANKAEAFAKAAQQTELFKKSLQDTTQKLQGVANEFAKQASEMAKQRNAGASLAKKLALGGPEAQRDFKQGLKTFWKLQTGQISARQVMRNPALAARLEKFSEMAGDAKIGGVNVGDAINSKVYEPAANRMFGSPTRQQEGMVKMQEAALRGEAAKGQEALNKIASDNIVKANQELIKSQVDLALEIQRLTLEMRVSKEKMNLGDNKSAQEKNKEALNTLQQSNLTTADAEVISKNSDKFKELITARSQADSYGDARQNALDFKNNGNQQQKDDINFLMKGRHTAEALSDPEYKAKQVQTLSKATKLSEAESEDILKTSAETGNDVEKIIKNRAQSYKQQIEKKESTTPPELLQAYQKVDATVGADKGSNALAASQTITSAGGVESVQKQLAIQQQQQNAAQQRIQQLEQQLSATQQQQQQPLKFAKGGVVPGTGNTDSVPALLTPGEIVIPKGFANGGIALASDKYSDAAYANMRVPTPELEGEAREQEKQRWYKEQEEKKAKERKLAEDKAVEEENNYRQAGLANAQVALANKIGGNAPQELQQRNSNLQTMAAPVQAVNGQNNPIGQAYLQHTQMFQQAQQQVGGAGDLSGILGMNQQQIRNYRMQAAAMIGTQMQISLAQLQNSNTGIGADPTFRRQAMFRIQQMQATRMNLMGNPRRFNSKEEIDAAVNFYGVSHQGLLEQTGMAQPKAAKSAAPAPAPAPSPAPAPVPPVTQGQAIGGLAVTGAQAFGQTTLGQSVGNTFSGISNMFRGGQQNARGAANGGSIMKPQGTDTVPTMLTPGEFVMKKSAVDQIGVNNLSQMNNSKSYFAGGGFVGNSANLDQSTSFNQAAAGFDGFAASFNTSVTNFNASVETFGAKVAEFASAVSTMPATLTVNGEVGANVTTNAAGIISQISNAVQSMIASQVVKSLPQPSMDQASKPS